jgi:hypothetical protein
VGCFVERPEPIQRWFEAHRKTMPFAALHDSIEAWHARDHGATITREFIGMLTAASAGRGSCSALTQVADTSTMTAER